MKTTSASNWKFRDYWELFIVHRDFFESKHDLKFPLGKDDQKIRESYWTYGECIKRFKELKHFIATNNRIILNAYVLTPKMKEINILKVGVVKRVLRFVRFIFC